MSTKCKRQQRQLYQKSAEIHAIGWRSLTYRKVTFFIAKYTFVRVCLQPILLPESSEITDK